MTAVTPPLADALLHEKLTVLGRLSTASNVTLVAQLGEPRGHAATKAARPVRRVRPTSPARPAEPAASAQPVEPVEVVYKPTAGTRPLWDFDADVLARHEVAAYEVAAAAAAAAADGIAAGAADLVAVAAADPTVTTPLVPLTVLRSDGPFGEGSVQLWVEEPADAPPVIDVVTVDEREPGWLAVFEAMDDLGRDVVVVHADDRRLRRMAMLDEVLNNADRKGQHVLAGADGALYGVDHGLCFHDEPKLRTVLWGWAGETFDEADVAWLRCLDEAVHDRAAVRLAELLPAVEVAALQQRLAAIAGRGGFRLPPRGRHAIPWPPL